MRQQKNWTEKAIVILMSYQNGQTQGALTQAGLAHQLGVSRQTLWRDKEVRLLYSSTQTFLKENKNLGRNTKDMRIRSLEIKLEEVRSENNLLIQIIIRAAQLMTEDTIDPRKYFDDATS